MYMYMNIYIAEYNTCTNQLIELSMILVQVPKHYLEERMSPDSACPTIKAAYTSSLIVISLALSFDKI